jgi:hypothetical protein
MRVMNTLTCFVCALAVLSGGATAYAQTAGEAPTAEQRVAAIKQNLAQSQKNLMQYQWTETTVVSYKGEEKSSTASSCSHGADGKVVKAPVSAPAEKKGKRGLRGKVAENKKEEMSSYMQSAVALIMSYVPPDPAKIQACKEAGKMTMTVTEPGKRARIDFKDYEKPGDNLGVEIDLTTNQILGLSVASYIDDAKDAVSLSVAMATLPDGTGYPSTIEIDAPAKEMAVAVTNSAYQKKVN